MRRFTALLAAAGSLLGCPTEVELPDTAGAPAGAGGGGGEAGALDVGGSGGTTPEDCSSLDDACGLGVATGGGCVRAPRRDDTPCDDGLACTTGDHCEDGACVPAAPYHCLSTDPCNVASCNAETGLCELTQANDGAPCDDLSFCTSSDICLGGVCVGEEIACENPDDGDPCQKGQCDPNLGCHSVPENLGEMCGPASFCSTYRCQLDAQNPQYAGCYLAPTNEGVPCDDDNACTGPDVCQLGECRGFALDNGTPCEDGYTCSLADTCADGWCVAGASDCPASGAQCVAMSCMTNPFIAACLGQPDWGSSCEDPGPCRGAGVCSRGVCAGATPANEGLGCDDGQACSTGEACVAGECLGVAVTSCTSGDGCCPAGCEGVDADCGGALYMASTQGLPGFYRFDLETEQWLALPDPPAPPRSRLVWVGGRIHVWGEDRAIHGFDPGSGLWSTSLSGPPEATTPAWGPAGDLLLPVPGGFFLNRDNYWAYRSVGPTWMFGWAFYGLDAGTFEASSGDLFIRANSGGVMLSVFHIDVSTNNESLWAEGNFLDVSPTSRFASLTGGVFYTVTSPATHTILAVPPGYGTATLTNLTTADPDPASDLDPASGLIYLGPSDSGAAFEVFDPVGMTLSPLPSPPPIPDGYLSSVAVVRAPSAP